MPSGLERGTLSEVDELARLVDEAGSVVAFTGAGISTESGIPDFRSAGSPWLRHPPIEFALFMRSEEARREAWRRKFAIDDLCRDPRPNAGHLALAALVARGKATGIITQNIDGLHQASGVADAHVVELHGNGTYATCLGCNRRHELSDVRRTFEADGAAPRCDTCGGPVKSATISFGQAMPDGPMRRARQLSLACDLFLAIGSSLLVHPAAGFPLLARRNRARLVIVNRDPTALDDDADLVVRGESGAVLPALVAALAATH